jgi:peroxiredoxin
VSTQDGAVAVQRPNPPNGSVGAAHAAHGLRERLTGQQLPDLDLTTSDAIRLPLRAHVSGLVVLYFTAGHSASDRDEGAAHRDIAQHRGYVAHSATFAQLGAKVFGVSTQHRDHLRACMDSLAVRHIMFSDPELAIADALSLPSTDADARGYRRIALVADNGIIQATFGPSADEMAGGAEQPLAWLRGR